MNTGVFKPFVRVSKPDRVPSDALLMIWISRFPFLFSDPCFFDDLEIPVGQKLGQCKQGKGCINNWHKISYRESKIVL